MKKKKQALKPAPKERKKVMSAHKRSLYAMIKRPETDWPSEEKLMEAAVFLTISM